jgi:hypothetical protein
VQLAVRSNAAARCAGLCRQPVILLRFGHPSLAAATSFSPRKRNPVDQKSLGFDCDVVSLRLHSL